MLVKQYDFIHIKTATLLANEITNQTSTGIQAQPFVENGKLVPDQLITNLVFKALKENDVLEKGYVLEGYPRTKQQAIELLQAGFLPDHVLDIDLPDHKIIEYAASGLVDPVTNRLSEKRKSIVKTSSSSFLDRPPMDLGIVQRKLRDYRKFTQTFIGLFKSSYKRFNLSDGFEGQEQKLLLDIQNFLGTSAVTKAPRSFRIIVAGLPGSGKSTVAEKISSKFGAVLVSPKSVMLQAISAGNGQEFMPYLTNPHSGKYNLL
jgi:adenylate kinase